MGGSLTPVYLRGHGARLVLPAGCVRKADMLRSRNVGAAILPRVFRQRVLVDGVSRFVSCRGMDVASNQLLHAQITSGYEQGRVPGRSVRSRVATQVERRGTISVGSTAVAVDDADSSTLNRLLTGALNAPNISPAGMTC